MVVAVEGVDECPENPADDVAELRDCSLGLL